MRYTEGDPLLAQEREQRGRARGARGGQFLLWHVLDGEWLLLCKFVPDTADVEKLLADGQLRACSASSRRASPRRSYSIAGCSRRGCTAC